MLQFLRTAIVPFPLAWKGVKYSYDLVRIDRKLIDLSNFWANIPRPWTRRTPLKMIFRQKVKWYQPRTWIRSSTELVARNSQRFYLSYVITVTGHWYVLTDVVWLKDVQNAIGIFLSFRWISMKFVRYNMMINVEWQSLLIERNQWDNLTVTLSSQGR